MVCFWISENATTPKSTSTIDDTLFSHASQKERIPAIFERTDVCNLLLIIVSGNRRESQIWHPREPRSPNKSSYLIALPQLEKCRTKKSPHFKPRPKILIDWSRNPGRFFFRSLAEKDGVPDTIPPQG